MDESDGTSSTLELAFSKIRLQQNSTVVQVKRPASLLLAIDSTLINETKHESVSDIQPQAYLIALLATLDQLVSTTAPLTGDKRELLDATLYLLSLLTPHLTPTILRQRQSTLATLAPLFPVLTASAPATKSLIAVAQSFLASLSPTNLERDLAGARTTYAHVLGLCADPRPKVRRRAQEAVQSLLRDPPPPSGVHPYASESAEWILARLEDAVKGAKRGGKAAVATAAEEKQAERVKKANKEVTGAAEVAGSGQSDESRAIALLTFIKNLGSAWDDKATPTLLQILLSILPLSSSHLTLSALTLLSHLFSAQRQAELADRAETLGAQTVEDTLEALIDARPRNIDSGASESAEKLMSGWVEGVGEGLVAFARSNPASALARTGTVFPTILPLLASATTPLLRQSTETALELCFRHCIPDTEVRAAARAAATKTQPAADKPGRVLLDLIELVNAAITSPRYAALAQPHVLALCSTLFSRLRLRPSSSSSSQRRPQPAAVPLLGQTLASVARARESSGFEWKREADAVLDAAVRVVGPEAVLKLLPLGLDPDIEPDKQHNRAWLLPLLKPAVTNTRLAHFKDTFVPLSARMFEKADAARARQAGMEAKVWDTLVGQIWALLNGYCEYPEDLVEAFDTAFVGLLANVVYAQPALRPAVFKALSTLVSTTQSLAKSTSPPEMLKAQFGLSPSDGQRALQRLRELAPTVLGVAFNVYGKMPRGEGAYVLTTVGDWFGVLGEAELSSTYDRIESLLKQALAAGPDTAKTGEDGAISPVHALLDIVIAFIPYAGPVERRLFDLAASEQVLGAQVDQAVQKKGYRMLARLCEERNGAVVRGREGEVVEALVDAAGKVAQGAKRDRTVLLSTLVPLIPPTSLHHIPSLIPEAVLGTKESNERTREAAYELVVGMARKMEQGGTINRSLVKGMQDKQSEGAGVGMAVDEVAATVEEFVTMVSAGLAAVSPHMISATITSLSRLIFEFHATMSNTTLTELLNTIIIFLGSANREIVRSAIGYVKVSIVSLPSSIVEPSLPELVPALINWSHEHSNHFKVKIRHILERLLRKFGHDKVEPYVPEDDKKLVNNIRKRQARLKKKKADRADEDGEDENMDAEPAPKPQVAGRSAYDEVLYGSDSEGGSDSDDEQGPSARAGGAAAPGVTRSTGVKNRKSQARKQKREEGAYIHESDDEVLDLLDDRMMSKISAARPTKAVPRKPLDSHFKTDAASGRMRIEEDEKQDTKARPSAADNAIEVDDSEAAATRAGSSASAMGAYLEAMRGEDGHRLDQKGRAKFNKTQGKRARGDFDDDAGDVPVTEGLKELEVSKKKRTKRETERIGGEFKAKRAGGDVKKNGMSPYAYVPLQNVAGKKQSKGGPKMSITGLKSSGKKQK